MCATCACTERSKLDASEWICVRYVCLLRACGRVNTMHGKAICIVDAQQNNAGVRWGVGIPTRQYKLSAQGERLKVCAGGVSFMYTKAALLAVTWQLSIAASERVKSPVSTCCFNLLFQPTKALSLLWRWTHNGSVLEGNYGTRI